MPSRELDTSPNGAPTGTGVYHSTGTLKKHKTLPHPRRNGSSDYSAPSSVANSSSASRGLSLETNTDVTSPSSISASPRTLKHTSRRIIGSIDLPPTPPAHSRNSSNDASLPLRVVTNGDLVESPACSTPLNVQSPPTPDFTPPRPRRVEAVTNQSEKRREMGSRNDSMNTTTSFVTAKEELESDQDGSSTIRPDLSSPIDQMDFREDDDSIRAQPPPKMKSLGLGLEGLEDAFARHKTPTRDADPTPLRKKFSFEHDFDEDFTPDTPTRGGAREVENPILSRNVTITRGKTRRKPYNFDNDQTPTHKPVKKDRARSTSTQEVLADPILSTPNAVRQLRSVDIEVGGEDFVKATPRQSLQPEEMARAQRRAYTQPEKLTPIKTRQDSITQQSHDARKFSHGSQISNSTVETAVMVPPQQLKMRRTLRHKERMVSLRDFSPSHAPPLAAMNGGVQQSVPRLRHKSVDLPLRKLSADQTEEHPKQVEQQAGVLQGQRARKVSNHRLPERPRAVVEREPQSTTSRQVPEQIVAEQSRKVSGRPLPQQPDEVAKDHSTPQPQKPLQTQPPPQSRRYSIERKPLPERQRMLSNASTATAASNDTSTTTKARSRKQLLAEGVIPVVIVPRRTSSLKEQSKPPSLRSTSTNRNNSKAASRSSSTAPLSASAGTNIPGAFPESNPPSIRQRRNSDGAVTTPKEDGLVRSIDFGPPAIPVRKSSMSAPTTPMGSRNVSRSNSLTADSLRRHNEAEALAAVGVASPETQAVQRTIQQRRDENRDSGVGYGVGIHPPASNNNSVTIQEPEQENRHRNTHLSVDTNGDPLFGQRLSAQVTPFSARSDVTGASHGTALEVAQARQVEMFNHQNTSVQLVDQEPPSSSASDSINLRNKSLSRPAGRPTTSSSSATARPKLTAGEKYSSTSLATSQPNGKPKLGLPTTNFTPASPPQPSTRFDDSAIGGDSPLINPRNPPQPPAGPPAFKIIPPTPAALAAQEEGAKQLGWDAPLDINGEVSRPPRRNWSLRSVGGLVRSLSLKRGGSLRARDRDRRVDDVDIGGGISAPIIDDERPAEEGKLHPFWRPANYREEGEEECDCEECRDYWAGVESQARQAKRDSFPPVAEEGKAQRPGMPRRTTSQLSTVSRKLRKTFAILPIAGIDTGKRGKKDEGYNVSYATARRTIKRSGSGNLKVVKRVGNVSKESLKLQEYLNRAASKRGGRFGRLGRKGEGGKGEAAEAAELAQEGQSLQPRQSQRKRFSWVGGSTDNPAGRYPPVVAYPPASNNTSSTSNTPLKRTFSLPTTSFPPRVQINLPSFGVAGLARRFSEKGREERREEKREGLRRTISAPRGVRDGVEEVVRRREGGGRGNWEGREMGVQTEDFGGR